MALAQPFKIKIPDLIISKPIVITPGTDGYWELDIAKKRTCAWTTTAADKSLTIDTQCKELFALHPKVFDSKQVALLRLDSNEQVLEQIDLELVPLPPAAEVTWSKVTRGEIADKLWYFDDGWREIPKGFKTDVALQFWRIDDKGVATTGTIVKELDPQERAEVEQQKLEQRCAAERQSHRNANVLCFVYVSGWTRLADDPESGTLMRPNRRVKAIAFAPKGERVTLELSGQTGLSDPVVRNETAVATALREGSAIELVESSREWGPRAPGVHTLTATLKKAPADEVASVEIVVEQAYAGAVRLGVGAVFGGARGREFSAQALPGSGQSEITTSAGGVLDAELVLGVAAFFDGGGRTYANGPSGHWAPYFGIGLLNETTSGFEVLSSLHLGVEYEISKQFSIAATVVGRKVTRLADGLEVGDPISSMTIPTRTGYELGVGVVINLSPEFLKLAKGQAQRFFK